MNKRIIKKLTRKNAIKISKLNVQPGETVAITFDPRVLHPDQAYDIYERLMQEFPDVKFVGVVGVDLSNKITKAGCDNE